MELLPAQEQQAEPVGAGAGTGAGAQDRKDFYREEIERYKLEKAEIKLATDKLEAEATARDRKSDEQMHLHHRWARAITALKVSIALAANALLTRKKWIEIGMIAVGAIGLGIGALAVQHI